MKNNQKPEYSILAEVYDTLMQEVDYEVWADFIDEIIQTHHPDPRSILELACGTGSLSLSLDELMCYDIMATDKSKDMIRIAREKAIRQKASVSFQQMDFLNIGLDRSFDVVISLFDSVNYLHHPEDIRNLLSEVKKVLSPRGFFIFDFTTPRNSVQAIQYLHNEEGHTRNNYKYFRTSKYDARKRMHYNDFEILKLDDDDETVHERYLESHRQRIYTLEEMLAIIEKTDYNLVAKYDAFDLVEATDKSLRITLVLQCPTMQL